MMSSYSDDENYIIVRYLEKTIFECWRLPEEQNVLNIQNDKILWLLSHCDIVLIFEVIYSGYVSLILLIQLHY